MFSVLKWKPEPSFTGHFRTGYSAFFPTHRKLSGYDQGMPQSHTANQPTAPWGRGKKR